MEFLHPCLYENAYDKSERAININPYKLGSCRPTQYHQDHSNIELNEVKSSNYHYLEEIQFLKNQINELTFEKEGWEEKNALLKDSFKFRWIKYKDDLFRKSMDLDHSLKENAKLTIQMEDQ